MFLSPSSFAALDMAASILARTTFSSSSSLPRSVGPLLVSHKVSCLPFLCDRHQFRHRISPRLCNLHSAERHSKPESIEDDVDWETDTITGDVKDESSATVGQEFLKEAALEDLRSASGVARDDTAFDNVDPSSLGRRRKRKQFVAQAPMRLHSEEEDLGFMQEALAEARKGAKKGEVPVGAVLVHNKRIIARFHNQ